MNIQDEIVSHCENVFVMQIAITSQVAAANKTERYWIKDEITRWLACDENSQKFVSLDEATAPRLCSVNYVWSLNETEKMPFIETSIQIGQWTLFYFHIIHSAFHFDCQLTICVRTAETEKKSPDYHL